MAKRKEAPSGRQPGGSRARANTRGSPRRSAALWAAIVGVAVLMAGILVTRALSTGEQPGGKSIQPGTPTQATLSPPGGGKIAFDTTSIDIGTRKVTRQMGGTDDVPVKFTVTNTGSGPLAIRVPDAPKVLEGC